MVLTGFCADSATIRTMRPPAVKEDKKYILNEYFDVTLVSHHSPTSTTTTAATVMTLASGGGGDSGVGVGGGGERCGSNGCDGVCMHGNGDSDQSGTGCGGAVTYLFC